ncbi:Sporulation kinase A [Enhygromyxa salina]|uniref:histidine kinase n=2 Tax=Enhygromyxa salina TaxID=215803 RepID=A0A2S9XJW5_9BACT|nr:Sporulation kinase A [Enhygromyxa salina]
MRASTQVVIVDSDDERRIALAAALRRLGHEVQDYGRVPESNPSLASAEVAIVAGQPALTACALYRRTRRARFVLALVEPEQLDEALAAGANDCLTTPVTPAQVAQRLRIARGTGSLGAGTPSPAPGASGDELDGVVPQVSGLQLRAMFDSLPMPVAIVSAAGVFLQCNREVERALHQPRGAVVGKTLTEVFANEDLAQIFADLQARGRMRDQELELRTRVGQPRWVAAQARWIPSEGGGYAIGTFVDITERRATEAALRASESSLRSVLQATPDGIIVHSEGRYLFVNPAAMRQLGFTDDAEIIGESIYEQLVSSEVDSVRARIQKMICSGEPAGPRDLQFQRANGEIYVGEIVSIPARFDGAAAIITIVRDISEQRRIQSQMFLADRLATVGTLAVGVAHEINNPLSWVIGNLGLLADEFDNQVRMRELPGHDPVAVGASRARVRELLGRAQEGTERVRRIVRDLGRFGRTDDAEGQVVDIHALLDSTIEIADMQIRHRARLARNYLSAGYARGGEARLGQVFLNLLVNAGQAIEPGAPRENRVKVETRDLDDGRLEIAISDTGCGITEDVRARIFEPFFTTKPIGEGTGIGLAISRDIVASMAGEIVVESEVGRGTTFRVRLPPATEDVPSPKILVESEGVRVVPAVRVLVVDDEPLIREMVCDALAKHEVTAVANGRDALEQIIAQDWDLILCDMILPELSGVDVYRELEQARPDALEKFVFMTGGELSAKDLRLPSGAAARRLEKPFSIKALRSLVRAARPSEG